MQKSDSNAQVPPTLATGVHSATGAALGQDDHEIPTGKDAGSTVEIAGGDIRPDSEAPAPIGAQAEPARFTSNGQLPHNTVGSPTGSVPVGALGLSVEDSEKRVEQANAEHDAYVARRGKVQRLAPETVQRLHASEIQAIAQQRGYVLPAEGGARFTRAQFLKAQDADKNITDEAKKASARKSATKKASTRRR